MFQFLFDDGFLDDLKGLDKKIQSQVKAKLKFFTEQENPLFYAKKLKGEESVFRFRIGDYRAVFLLDDDEIILLRLAHRRDVYKKKK